MLQVTIGAQVAREMLAAGEYEDVVSKWANETQRRWYDTKFVKLWQRETRAGRDPRKAFAKRVGAVGHTLAQAPLLEGEGASLGVGPPRPDRP